MTYSVGIETSAEESSNKDCGRKFPSVMLHSEKKKHTAGPSDRFMLETIKKRNNVSTIETETGMFLTQKITPHHHHEGSIGRVSGIGLLPLPQSRLSLGLLIPTDQLTFRRLYRSVAHAMLRLPRATKQIHGLQQTLLHQTQKQKDYFYVLHQNIWHLLYDRALAASQGISYHPASPGLLSALKTHCG